MFGDYEDDLFNLGDFEFNFNMQTSLETLEPIREFSKSISYVNYDDDSSEDDEYDEDNEDSDGDEDDDEEYSVNGLLADEWFSVLDFVPFVDFSNFAKVCPAFAEILTYNRRYLVMKKILKDFPTLLQDSHYTSIESLANLVEGRSPSDDPKFGKSLHSDIIHYLIEKKRYKKNIFNYIPKERIPLMDHSVFVSPFKIKLFKTTFWDFPTFPESIRNNREYILKLFNSHKLAANLFVFLSNEMKSDREIVLRALHCNGYFLKELHYRGVVIDDEIVNAALQSKTRTEIRLTTYHGFDFNELFNKYTSPIISTLTYKFANEESLLHEIRKIKYDGLASVIALDRSVNNKNHEFLLQLAYFEMLPLTKLSEVLLHFHNSKMGEKRLMVFEILTEITCFPERFPYLSQLMTVHKCLKTKTKQLSVRQVVNRLLENNFIFELVLSSKEFELTASSIEYMRERIIHRNKFNSYFAKMYFEGALEEMTSNNPNEKSKFLTELSTKREFNLKVLKYFPKYYSKLREEFKQDDKFIEIALGDIYENAQYFDFSKDEIIVKALSSNFVLAMNYFKDKLDWESLQIRIENIFFSDRKIKDEWLSFPNIFKLCQYLSISDVSKVPFEKLSTKQQILFVTSFSKTISIETLKKLKHKNSLGRRTVLDMLSENSEVKNNLDIVFTYVLSYKYAPEIYVKIAMQKDVLVKVLRKNPKFIKVFFKNPRFSIPFEDLKMLTRQVPKAIHYLPKQIQHRINNPLVFK